MEKKDIFFKDYREFFIKRKDIKKIYLSLNMYEKRYYKNYIYSLRWRPYFLDIVWERLNEPMSSEYYIPDSELRKYFISFKRNRKNIEL